MTRIRKSLLIFLAVALSLVCAGAVVIHLPVVQEAVWNRVIDAIHGSSGWRITADAVHLRMWPARFEAKGISVGTGGPPAIHIDRLEMSFRWRTISRRPHGLDSVEIEGLRVDLRRFQPPKSSNPRDPSTTADAWNAVEVGELSVTDGALVGTDGLPVGVRLSGLTAGGTLKDGQARLEATTDVLSLDKDGRIMDLGPLIIKVHGGPDGGWVDSLDLAGDAITVHAAADVSITPPRSAQALLTSSVDLARLVPWWDPTLAAQAAPRGRLELEGRATFDDRSGLEFELEHSGSTITIGELVVDTLGVTHRDRHTHVWADFGGQGRLEIDAAPDGPVRFSADLDDLPLDATLRLLDHPLLAHLPRGLDLSSRMTAEVRLPLSADSLSANGWLRTSWPQGEIELSGSGTSDRWDVDELRLAIPGATAKASGSGRTDRISTNLEIDAHDPAALFEYLDRWRPELGDLGVGGGPFHVSAAVKGTVTEPTATGSFQWRAPEVAPYSLTEIQGTFAGGAESLDWRVVATAAPGAHASAEAMTQWSGLRTTGLWTVDVQNVGALPIELTGALSNLRALVEGGGRFAWAPNNWLVDGVLDAREVGTEDWHLDTAGAAFEATPERLVLEELRLTAGAGFVRATGSLTPPDVGGRLDANLNFEQIAIEEFGAPVAGTVSGNLNLSGSPAAPEGVGMMAWNPPEVTELAAPLIVTVRLTEGVAEVDVSGWETAAGPVSGRATLPVGDMPRPEWLWPGAPGGPLRVHLDGLGMRSAPVLAALGREPLAVQASGDLSVDLQWDPADPNHPLLQAEVGDLAVTGPNVRMTAQQKLRLRVGDGRIELEPLRLQGPLNRMDIGGVYEMETTRLVGGLEMVADASFLELLPYPVQATGSMTVRAGVDGPLDTAAATVEVDHSGGTIVLREPAARITDLRLHATMVDGILWIDDGEAGVNRGRVLIGGGWDPASGQGVVFEIDEVTALLTSGIVTNWSGTIAIEPTPGFTALVVGDLDLNAGLWERTFDLTGAFLGSSVVETEGPEILSDIALDLQVRGYSGVRVDNNLGHFDATWGLMEISGTAARPTITGGLRLAPGGTVNLPGQTVTIRTAQVDFTGNPDTDPVIEIIPESLDAATLFGDGGSSSVDTRAMATESLARGLGSALGFENTTLQPAEIAFETQTDASAAFTAGTRLSRTVALFFTTDLSDVQNQTTLLQLWNLRGLRGLALQGYTKTADDEIGVNAIERYRWGGTKPTDDKPVIQKIKMEGDWPLGTRRLRRATGLRKGEPFDSFLLFVAGLNLEAELASAGYPRARVHGEAEGDERLPALIFTVDPGEKQDFNFTGAVPPAKVQQVAIGQYLPKPHETKALEEMRRTVAFHFMSEGYPDTRVTVEREVDVIVIHSELGEAMKLAGPVVEGVPEDISRSLQDYLGSPVELARISRDPGRAAVVVDRLLAMEGFPDAHLEDVWVDAEGEVHLVHLRIIPGEPVILGGVVVDGDDPLGIATDGIPGLVSGVPVDRGDIDRALGRVRSRYRAAGYSEIVVDSQFSETDGGELVLTVNLDPGRQRTLRQVHVTGLRHIRESVILNGLEVEPEDTVTPEGVDQSAIDTAFFAPVDQASLRTIEAGPNQVDLEIDITEKPRWTVEAGAGWSTERGARLQFGFRDEGLLGRGAGVSLRGQWEQTQQSATLYLSLPPLPGGRWSSVANIGWYDGDSRENRERFTEQRIGGGAETTYSIGRSMSVRGYLQFTETEQDVKDPEDDPFDFFPITTREAILGTQLRIDRLDNPFDPRSGWLTAMDLSHNTPELGSDFDDLRMVLTGSSALAPLAGWTWAQTLRLGAATAFGESRLASVRRFYAGGQASVRGFDLDSIGPYEIDNDGNPNPTGGGALLVLNEELRVPVWRSLRLAVFADVGQVWETWSDASFEFSVGAGFGFRFSTPVGPLWADVAWPVANPNVSSPGPKYYVGIGTPF